jgi:hypothetical protein
MAREIGSSVIDCFWLDTEYFRERGPKVANLNIIGFSCQAKELSHCILHVVAPAGIGSARNNSNSITTIM